MTDLAPQYKVYDYLHVECDAWQWSAEANRYGQMGYRILRMEPVYVDWRAVNVSPRVARWLVFMERERWESSSVEST